MSLTRPRRKATINKSYNDTLDESHYEDPSVASTAAAAAAMSLSAKRKQSSKKSPEAAKPPKSLKLTLPHNWQAPPTSQEYFSHKLDLEDAYIDFESQTLYCPNQPGFSIQKGEYVYMVSEPPGEPYYIGRIMGFKRKRHDKATLALPGDTPVPNGTTSEQEVVQGAAQDYLFQIQWFYRPRDISKSTADSRLLFSSMHTDSCPITSYRGKVTVKHKQDIEDSSSGASPKKKASTPTSRFEAYTQNPNCFYFDKLFDRYMLKFYDVLLTANLLQYCNSEDSKSRNYLIALNKRFEFIFVESQRTKSLINSFSSSSCNCVKCGQWCDSNLYSISCVVCNKYFHMYCLDPPLTKKPSRGFSWSCALCTKKQDLEYHRKKILMLSHDNKSSNASQLSTELSALSSPDLESKLEDSLEVDLDNRSDDKEENGDHLPKYETMAIDFLAKDKHLSLEQRRLKEEWCMRYLGMHSRLEDGVDLEDRSPYPRASTRLGAKHQATNIPEFYDHPLVYYDIDKAGPKKKGSNPSKKIQEKTEALPKLHVPEEYKDTNPKEYPQWLQPRPKGYVERGVDDGEGVSCTLMWKLSESDIQDGFTKLEDYVKLCAPTAELLGIVPSAPNFMDFILKTYMDQNGDIAKSLEIVQKLTKKALNEPVFNKEEIKRFESGVKQFGSELYFVSKKVKTQPTSMVVRYYYLWKKTKNGKLIWGNFEGRAQKKVQNMKDENKEKIVTPTTSTIDDLADPEDDSSYEDDKVIESKRPFTCKHCLTHSSHHWFRMTGHDAGPKTKVDEDDHFIDKYLDSVIALCFRCARLWRRYAVVWEDPLEVEKKNTKTTGWKKKIEWELLQDSNRILDEAESKGLTLSFVEEQVEVAVPDKKKSGKTRRTETIGNNTIQEKVEEEPPKKKKPTPPKKKTTKATAESKPPTKRAKKEQSASLEPNDTPAPPKDNKDIKDVKNNRANGNSKEPKETKEIKETKPAKETKSRKRKIKEEQPAVILSDVIESFRKRQLLDITSQFQGMQIPHLTSVALPFETNARKCCLCREDDGHSQELEMLICSHCGVNVHGSCIGIQIPDQVPRPVKEWLCEPCINDLKPNRSTVYTCSLCLANESNYELAILGSPLVRPDFLKSIHETGKWCHLLCAIFNHNLVEFKALPSSSSSKKLDINSTKSIIESVQSPIAIEGVSKVHLKHYHSKCGICDSRNGSMIRCDICSNDDAYHVTCAQDTPYFHLGFELDSSKFNEKDGSVVKVGEKIGKLRPVLICPKHEKPETVESMRAIGHRLHGGGKDEAKPLVLLFLEDLVRHNASKLTGPQFRSNNYIQNCKLFEEEDKLLRAKVQTSYFGTIPKRFQPSCGKCHTVASPVWWANDVTTNQKYMCQTCHRHTVEGEGEVEEKQESLLELLGKPLDGSNYGVRDQKDDLLKVYHENTVETSRSRISIGDILS
ncbi:uncharacterized protein CANTADRAFT_71228 [Suhomyces tanzawaensis NRRL Y-17324]|uniref:BAH-domain-containing protein n=1 Tax=Suhomyces tanzawaensis NRRL Y-17324 TaxID=984487 RepID=A0A1E4SBR5_9ASCO|nr:uncharacterized protein CANTADRAFT_71228 [Suhomyces tanzawaensis NRRL Y-17324]ODV76943.1 hypothetical protein CANTADRAFT_71228 [Suhomyces tanzawaensis NRRL Y-17324]